MDEYQVVLDGARCSGRGIKFRQLSAAEHDAVRTDAAKVIGDAGTMFDLRKAEMRLGAKRMLTAVTVKTGLKQVDILKAEWQAVNEQVLDEKYEKFFTAKDHSVLCALYHKYHELDASELDDIEKKVLTVVAS